MTEREQRQRGPYPGEVPLSRASRPDPGAAPPPEAPVRPTAETEPTADHDAPPADVDLPVRSPDRAPNRDERRAMVPLLAQALSTQLARVASDDAAPEGWWFTPQR